MKGRIAIIKKKLEKKNKEILEKYENGEDEEALELIIKYDSYMEPLVDLTLIGEEKKNEIIKNLLEIKEIPVEERKKENV